MTISNFNLTFNSLIDTTLNTYLRISAFNSTNQSNINNLNTLNSMIYPDGDVSINCNSNVNFKAVVNSQLRIPLSVRPTHTVVESTTNPSFIINNPTVANSNISFQNGTNYWTTGMEGGNFFIKSNFLPLYTIPAGSNLPSTVAVQINQDAFANFAGHMNIWGDVYSKRDLYVAGTFWGSGAINCVSQAIIYANSANTETKIAIFGGSSTDN